MSPSTPARALFAAPICEEEILEEMREQGWLVVVLLFYVHGKHLRSYRDGIKGGALRGGREFYYPFDGIFSLPGRSPEELMHYPRRRRRRRPHLR